MKKRIPFGVWEPDSGAVGGLGRVTKAINVVPMKGGYKAIFGWNVAEGTTNTFTTTVITPTNVIGAYSAVQGGATFSSVVDFVATTTAVYTLAETGATTPVVTGAAVTAPNINENFYFRDFTQYGREVIMTSGTNGSGTAPICYYDIGSSTVMTALGNEFQSAFVTVLRDFVVFGRTYDGVDFSQPYRVRWSAFGDSHQYTPSAATQADYQDLIQRFGKIQRVLGGNDVFIICEFGVVLMEYVGGATIMRFTYLHEEVGTAHSASCVRVGDYCYFYSKRGFVRVGKAFGDVSYIGAGRVDREFDFLLNDGNDATGTPNVRAYHDELNMGIGWQYGSDGRAIFYSYAADQWTLHGADGDRADAYFLYASKISYPSGGTPRFNSRLKTAAAIATSGKLYAQNDRDQKAKVKLATGFEELSPGKKSVVDKVWPGQDIRGGAQTNPELVVTSIPKLNGVNLYAEPTSTYSSTASLQSDGLFTVTGPGSYEGRFHRFQLENSDTASERAGEQAILGIDVEFFERGNY